MKQKDQTDIISSDEVKSVVLEAYSQVDSSNSNLAEAMYPDDALSNLPDEVVALALGVGHPVGFAELAAGETVLDLGSGGGIDTLLAAQAVGKTGKAIGLDITPEMVSRATKSAENAGYTNVEFIEGSMEEIPLPDEEVNVIISNGVISMSLRKHKVFWEAWRVLKPGGRIVFGDMALNGPLPLEVRKHPQAIAG